MKRALASSAILIAGYVAAARGVGNLFPLSTFEMYGTVAQRSASRIVARDAAGHVAEIEPGEVACAEPPSIDPRVCLDLWPFGHVPAEDEAAVQAIAIAHAEPGATPIDIVRRVWRLDGDVLQVEDCALARCFATR